MIRCEICGEPIEDKHCVTIDDGYDLRCMHFRCLEKRIVKVFSDCVGTKDDDIGQLIYDIIDAEWVSNTPDEPDGGGHLPPMKED